MEWWVVQNIANRRHRKLRELEDGTHATHITRTEFMVRTTIETVYIRDRFRSNE